MALLKKISKLRILQKKDNTDKGKTITTSAQHYSECGNCEEAPAEFLCKTCPGNLCENCKNEHKMKKITTGHEIVPLTSNTEEMVHILYCTDHTKKRLDCFCNKCRKPVCTDCIIHTHNGHSVDSLSNVYAQFKDYSENKKAEIENDLLPWYHELLKKENAKCQALKRRAEEMERKMKRHADDQIEKIQRSCEQSVASLEQKTNFGLKEMGKYMNKIEETISKLKQMSKTISENNDAKPHISFFQSIYSYDLKSFESFEEPAEYTLTDFKPGHSFTQKDFGSPPFLKNSCYEKAESTETSRLQYDASRCNERLEDEPRSLRTGYSRKADVDPRYSHRETTERRHKQRHRTN